MCIILYIFLQNSAYNRCGIYPKTLQPALEFTIKFCGFEQSLDDSEAAMLVAVEQNSSLGRSGVGGRGATGEVVPGPAQGGPRRESDPHSEMLAIDWWNI